MVGLLELMAEIAMVEHIPEWAFIVLMIPASVVVGLVSGGLLFPPNNWSYARIYLPKKEGKAGKPESDQTPV